MIQNHISFAGAGRVATVLCREMHARGHKIDLIVSETDKNGPLLSDECEATWSRILTFPDSSEIILVAVPDIRLKSVLSKVKCRRDTIVAHTAASMGLDIFPGSIIHKAVFYPFQTFSKERKLNFQEIPFFLESSDTGTSEILENLAKSIGGKVSFMNGEQRIALHLAAVFTANFTNHMLTLGKEIAQKSDIPFELMHPLIRETISKAIEMGPESSQTGPAVRQDQNTIEKHLELLSFSPEIKRIYEEVTRSIIKYHNKS